MDKKQRHYNLEKYYSFEENREYNDLVDSIPKLDVSYYASIKLTVEELQFAYDIMKLCNKENSAEMIEHAENYLNFFVSSYMVELLKHYPESNYIYSIENLGIMANNVHSRLRERMTEIQRKEQEDWKYYRYRTNQLFKFTDCF